MKRLGLGLLVAMLAFPLAASAHYADDSTSTEKTAPSGASDLMNLANDATPESDTNFLGKGGEHSKNQSPSNKGKHEKGQASKKKAHDRKEHDKKSGNQKKKERKQAGGRGGSSKAGKTKKL